MLINSCLELNWVKLEKSVVQSQLMSGQNVVGNDSPLVWSLGVGVRKVARHGTAALLNALHPAVDYPVLAAEVIVAVQAGDVSDLADYNDLSETCPAEGY
jgi:hypothetical protein